jgi:hypothetical protein
MSKEEVFRWRTNPNIIAQYIMDRHVPDGSRVTLKPNEACVILEEGRVIGVATQTEMEVNPKVGTLSRMFGKKSPSRSFLFTFLGPHEILLKLEGRTNDGQDVKGIAFLRVNIEREAAPRLLQLPAKGKTSVTISDLSSRLEMEASQKVASEVIATVDLESLRSDPDIDKDVEATLRISLRSSMDNLGLTMSSAWCSWNDTEVEKIATMRIELENMVSRNQVLDEMEAEDAQRIINGKLRQIELQHSLQVAELSAEAKQRVASELASMEAQRDVDQARWDTIRAQELRNVAHTQELAQSSREEELKIASHEIELVRSNLAKHSMVSDLEHSERLREQEVENQQMKFEKDIQFQEQERQVDLVERQKDAKTDRAMDMFQQVQDRKAKRLEQEADREQQRLGVQSGMSDKMTETLAQIASGSDDSAVAMEALKQLSELRKQDVQASSDAYVKDEDIKGEDELPKE